MDLFLLLFICEPTIKQQHTKKNTFKNENDSYYASNDSFIQRIGAVNETASRNIASYFNVYYGTLQKLRTRQSVRYQIKIQPKNYQRLIRLLPLYASTI